MAMSIRQSAVIAVRSDRVCLVLSQSGRRWVIPKGCIEPGQTAGETALQEAWEEAGILGHLSSDPVGTYHYRKNSRSYHVTVYLMKVTDVRREWPEKGQRARRWLPVAHAVARIEEIGLRRLLRKVLAGEQTEARV
jgi:8-oxo-dGTP pyrophosphatase MutT (NUDIX family)